MKWLFPVLLLTLFTTASASLIFYTTGNDTVSGYNITELFHFYITNDGPANISLVNVTIPYSYDVVDVDGPSMWTTETTGSYAWFNTAYPLEGGGSNFFNISSRSLVDGNHTWIVVTDNLIMHAYSQIDSTAPDISFASLYPVLVLISGDVSAVSVRWENDTQGNWTPMVRDDGFYTVDLPALEEGTYTLRVFANNTLGNVAYATTEYFEDHTPPEITLTSPVETTYTSEEIMMVYTIFDTLSPVVYCTYRLDTTTLPAGPIETGLEYSHRIVVSGDGSHVLYMNCTDLGGNSAQTEPIVFNVELPEEYQPPPVVYYPPEKEEEEVVEEFDVQASLISIELEQSQNRTFSIQIFSSIGENQTLTVNSTIFVQPFLTFPDELFLSSSSVVTLPVLVSIPENATRGFYTGEVSIFSNSTAKSVSISIEVVQEVITMLYSSVNVYDSEPRSGDELQLHVKVFNLGEMVPESVVVNYTVRPKDDNTPVFARSEQRTLGDITSYRTTLPLSGLEAGYYILELSVSGNNYTDRSFSSFHLITVSFWDNKFFGFRLRDIIISISTLVVVSIALWRVAVRVMRVLKERREKKTKYKQTLSELPKVGEDTIFVGKVAETKKGAYIHLSELTKHTLICGGTGGGKTVAAMVLAEEALMKDVSVTVFDPTLQWTGFTKENKNSAMLELYPEFGIKEPRKFSVEIDAVNDPTDSVNLLFEKGKMQVIAVNRLNSKSLDIFLDSVLRTLFDRQWQESETLKHLIIFDEVHRLLPRYGGSGKAIPMLERTIREFRKWGIGVVLVSQVLTDFKAAVRANVGNEIQLRTEFDGDIRRIKAKYGTTFSKNIAKLTVGTGMFQNPEYNKGAPYLVRFRPILHSLHSITPAEVDRIVALRNKLEELDNRMKTLEKQGVDMYQSRVELDLASKNLRLQRFSMVNAYVESIEKRLSEQ